MLGEIAAGVLDAMASGRLVLVAIGRLRFPSLTTESCTGSFLLIAQEVKPGFGFTGMTAFDRSVLRTHWEVSGHSCFAWNPGSGCLTYPQLELSTDKATPTGVKAICYFALA